jgi:hypothetical protein
MPIRLPDRNPDIVMLTCEPATGATEPLGDPLSDTMDVLRLIRRRATRWWPAGRSERSTHAWPTSAAVLALLSLLGWSALPGGLADGPARVLLTDARAGTDSLTPAVFALREDGTAVRFGNAELTPGGVIRVGFYDPLDGLTGVATEPVSLPADPRLLWLLASPAERQRLREQSSALVLAVSSAFVDIIRSPQFNASYRDRFVIVLRSAMQEAWQAAQLGGAWDTLLRSYDPILRDVIGRDVRPIVERHFRDVPLRMLRANALPLLDPFTDRPWDMVPVETALREAIADIRDHAVPERTVMELMDSPATVEFLRVFQTVLIGKLAHSPALPGLVAELTFDPKLRPYLAEVTERANDLARSAPHLLVSLHGSTDINLVAATVIRTVFSGRPDRVVVFMSPAQRDEIVGLDPNAVHLLARLVPNGP